MTSERTFRGQGHILLAGASYPISYTIFRRIDRRNRRITQEGYVEGIPTNLVNEVMNAGPTELTLDDGQIVETAITGTDEHLGGRMPIYVNGEIT